MDKKGDSLKYGAEDKIYVILFLEINGLYTGELLDELPIIKSYIKALGSNYSE